MEDDRMNLEMQDGFNFAIGEWLAEVTRLLISGVLALVLTGVIIGGLYVCEWWYDRRMKKK